MKRGRNPSVGISPKSVDHALTPLLGPLTDLPKYIFTSIHSASMLQNQRVYQNYPPNYKADVTRTSAISGRESLPRQHAISPRM
ncbi:hypothetical protein GDO78_017686 [Eleutherodactylus coqui]|uniref:Uncharacterized protein n=1 Tax=Eleutherodactylus coqui TaxID=57060 RepID=A0A8J6BEX5_ELECQ|nr:hypothetical protein GDO78_017686 [Eleutherodactylus coqui]